MKPNFKTPLSGIIPPLVTPLVDNETLDVESLERLIEHLIAGGVHGLFVLGTTGEEQSLASSWPRWLPTVVLTVWCLLPHITLPQVSPS